MAFQTTSLIGAQPVTNVDTVQQFPLGTLIMAQDSTYGQAEFIYLKGVASTVAGDLVIYDTKLATTVRTVAGSRGPAAVAQAAVGANQFGWYMIKGSGPITAGTVAAGGPVYVTATPGSTDDAVVATDKVDGIRYKTADGTPVAGQAVVQLDRPVLNGNG